MERINTTNLNDFLKGSLSLDRLEIIIVDVPQKEVFKSAIGLRKSRRALIVKWIDKTGAEGYGECSCRPDPFYSHEFVEGAKLVIEKYIFPLLQEVRSYSDLLIQLEKVRGWHFTKAAVESAANDAIRNRTGIGILEAAEIPQLEMVPVGISLGLFENAELLRNKVAEIKRDNYQRLKFKISRDYSDAAIIKEIGLLEHPYISLDANGSFNAESYELLSRFAELGNVIEQPFPPGDLYMYQEYLNEHKAFRMCLDEEVESYGNLVSNHLQIDELNIKPGRIGGLWNSLKMIEYCYEHGINAWIGGMFETSIGRAQNLQLASMLPDAKAHDLSPSSRYFSVDIVRKPIEMNNGFIARSNFTKIEVDMEILSELTIEKKTLTSK